jgi:predicted transcriptional regulator
MTSLNIPEDMDRLFADLAEEKNQPKDDLMLAALAEYLEDQADIKAADEVMADIRAGRDVPSSLEEVVRRLGLDN